MKLYKNLLDSDLFKNNFIFFIILLFMTVLRILHALTIELHPDEAYYWMWSRFPDLSYYDQGPGVSWYILLFTTLFGSSIFTLKLAALLPSLIISIAVYFISLELKLSRLHSAAAVLLLYFLPGFFGGSMLIMHDTPLVLFWILSIYAAVLFINTAKWRWFYLLAVFLGLGGLSKYTMVFFAISLVIWFLFSPEYYRLLKSPHLYAAVILAVFVSLPVFIWNFLNHLDGFDAIVHLRSSGGSMGASGKPGLFFAGQILSFSPILFFLAAGIIFSAISSFISSGILFLIKNRAVEKFSKRIYFQPVIEICRRDPAWRFLLINGMILPLFFLIFSGMRIIQANWVFPSYPALAVILIYAFSQSRSRFFQYSFYAGAAIAVLLSFVTLFSVELSRMYTAVSGVPISENYIPGYKTAGYKQIFSELEELRKGSDPDAKFAANRYQDAAIASFYLPGQPFIPSMNVMQKNQYSYWPQLEKGKNYYIFVIHESSKRVMLDLMEPTLAIMFQKVTPYPEKKIMMDGKVVKSYQVWYAENYVRGWDEPLVQYLTKKAILDLMPNMDENPRVPPKKNKKGSGSSDMMENFMFMKMMKDASGDGGFF